MSFELSIYIEALWVLVLFASTACLREAVGELCVHRIAYKILSSSHVHGKILDAFQSCSNGGRSLGFASTWRLWNINHKTVIVERSIIILPLLCWAIGLPIKLIAVHAVRGGFSILGQYGTWILGFVWITLCISSKLFAIFIDRFHGIPDKTTRRIVSFRRIYQLRFCTFDGLNMIWNPEDYTQQESCFIPRPKDFPSNPVGVDIQWKHLHTELSSSRQPSLDHHSNLLQKFKLLFANNDNNLVQVSSLDMKVSRRIKSDTDPNGLDQILKSHSSFSNHSPHLHLQ